MSDVDELGAAFEAGTLLRPDPSVPNLLDLARAVASVCGVPDVSLSAAGHELAGRLGAREHLVLVLVDGLGVQMIEDAGRGAALIRERLVLELRSVFPASTAVALTTLATAEWPAQHAITDPSVKKAPELSMVEIIEETPNVCVQHKASPHIHQPTPDPVHRLMS